MRVNTSHPQVIVFIDVANADGVDLRAMLGRARSLGQLDEARAYGDFRQRHLDELAIEREIG